jgi:hypothetical protein
MSPYVYTAVQEETMKYKLSIAFVLVLLAVPAFQSAIAAPGLFEPYITFPVSEVGLAVRVGDFNSDGLNDVAVVSANFDVTINNLTIMLQSADGTLGTPTVYSTGVHPASLAIGDVNNDGRTDIVTANQGSANISVFLQQDGGLMTDQILYTAGNAPDAVTVGDINNDGLVDVAVAHRTSPFIGIFIQNTDGALNEMVTYISPQTGYDDIEIADINNDGRNDVIKMNGRLAYSNLYVYLQNSAGTLESPLSYSIADCPSSCFGHAIETGDVTGDGLTDIVLAYGFNQIAVFPQASDGILQSSTSYDTYDAAASLDVADVNLDGRADVVTAHAGRSQVAVSLQLNGTLTPYSLYSVPYAMLYEHQSMDVGDINNDGAPDIVITDYENGLVVLYHTPPDNTPPSITVTAVKAENTPYIPDTWANQTVTVKFTCTDAESGIASCPADKVVSTEGITAETTGTATDNAGNSASVSFGPIKIDKTPPVLFVAVSPNPVLLNGSAELLKNAMDELSGVKPKPCLNIDTSTVGLKSVTCTVEDYAGNRTTTTTSYQVIYDFDGFLSPVIDCTNNPCDSYDLSIINTGSTIPLKFQLRDANGNVVRTMNPPLWLAPTRFEGTPPVSLPEDYGFQITNTPFEWKKNQEIYVYDWSTKGLPKRTVWLVGVRLDDGKTYYVFVGLK